MNKIRITHVIAALPAEDAANVFGPLVDGMDGDAFSNAVISLAGAGLVAAVRRSEPHIVQTWQCHADLIGGSAARFFSRVPVIWNLGRCAMDHQPATAATTRKAKLCARLSNSLPHAIVCGSHDVRDSYVGFGYQPDRMVVIPEGVDTTAFGPDPKCGAAAQSRVVGEYPVSLSVHRYEELFRRVYSQRYS